MLRGQELYISGTNQQVDYCCRLVRSLEDLWSRGKSISSIDILTSIQALETHQEEKLQDLQRVLARTRKGEEVRA